MERGVEREGRYARQFNIFLTLSVLHLNQEDFIRNTGVTLHSTDLLTHVLFSLGCDIGFGYLHRIPTRSLASKHHHHDTNPTSETLEEKHSSEVSVSRKKIKTFHWYSYSQHSQFNSWIWFQTFLENFSDVSGCDVTADSSDVSTPLENRCEKACGELETLFH